MRLQPIGRDKDGLMYWYQLDQEHNVRMYIEEQDDQDGSTWKCIVRYSFFFFSFFFLILSGFLAICRWGSEIYCNESSIYRRVGFTTVRFSAFTCMF